LSNKGVIRCLNSFFDKNSSKISHSSR